MTNKKLPLKLGKEPLIDVVYGVTFSSTSQAHTLLPGLLLSYLTDKTPKFEPLPASELPEIIRNTDPSLQNAPLVRVVVDEQFSVLIGSNWLGIGCVMPYAGWSVFRPMIIRIISVLKEANFIGNIQRQSIKYVDLIKSEGADKSLDFLNLEIQIAGRKLSKQTTQLRTEIIEPPFLHAATIISPAVVNTPTSSTTGIVVDVDTHQIEDFTVQEFIEQLPQLLDAIHESNKAFFFDLLSDSGLKQLEPKYD